MVRGRRRSLLTDTLTSAYDAVLEALTGAHDLTLEPHYEFHADCAACRAIKAMEEVMKGAERETKALREDKRKLITALERSRALISQQLNKFPIEPAD